MSEYRFRGLTQSDEAGAVQATLNLNSTTGFYVGSFISSIDDKVSLPGYGGAEVNFYGGYAKTLSNGLGVDVGMLYYYYPGGASSLDTDFFEPYATVSYTIGPVSARSEEHTSELQSLMRISYAVFCLKKKLIKL